VWSTTCVLHPPRGPDETDEALADRLARTFYEHRDARLVCRRAGFELAHLPGFGRPVVFWSEVIAAARAGANAGGVAALVDAAAKLVPNSGGARLDPGYVSLPENPAPSQYLVARYGVVEFTGRGRELAELDAWSERPGTVAVRLIYGPGGAGKTRLLLEWMKRRGEAGELAGFLRDEIDDAVIDWLDEAQKATLVIDYAETRAGLFELLRRLARSRTEDGSRRVRVVLLARNAGDWWASLLERNEEGRALLADSLVPLSVEPLVPSDERAREFSRAAGWFAVRRGRAVPSHTPVLNDPRFGRALYLHMAAFAAVEGLAAGVDQLLDGLLEHEAHFWLRRAGLVGGDGDPDVVGDFLDAARASMGAITLRGGVGDKPQAKLVVGRFTHEHAMRIVRLARELYPHSGDGWIGGLEPDLLGEALVRRLLVDRRVWPRWIDDAMGDADPQDWEHAFTVLGRVEDVEPRVASVYRQLLAGQVSARAVPAFNAILALGERTAHSRLGLELSSALAVEGTEELAHALSRIPRHTTMLRDVAVWVEQRLLESEQPDEERALRLTRLGVRLSDLGRREEALAATREAVDIYRKLAADHPDTLFPDFVTGLNNLGSNLSELARREEALAATREAVDGYRELSAARPDIFLPDLAMSLGNLGNRLSELGRREEALAASREAVDMCRELAEVHSEAILPRLALIFNNLGIRLSELGQLEEALAVTGEAVEVYRKLAAASPDAFLPDLAMIHNSVGILLSGLGRREEALTATDEAVDIYRKLVAVHPDAFLPELASSLNNLGRALFELGQREKALVAASEAVDVYRRLAEAHPNAFLPNLTGSLSNLGIFLSASGRREEALATAREAVDICRSLAEPPSDVFLSNLAMSLSNLGVLLSELEQEEEALATAREAVDIYRRLATSYPDTFLPNLAGSLNNLGVRLGELGRREALAATLEAMDIYRKLAAASPGTFIPHFARGLTAHGSILIAMGRVSEAGDAFDEALDAIWPYFEQLPDAFAQLTQALLQLRQATLSDQASENLATRIARYHEILGKSGTDSDD